MPRMDKSNRHIRDIRSGPHTEIGSVNDDKTIVDRELVRYKLQIPAKSLNQLLPILCEPKHLPVKTLKRNPHMSDQAFRPQSFQPFFPRARLLVGIAHGSMRRVGPPRR